MDYYYSTNDIFCEFFELNFDCWSPVEWFRYKKNVTILDLVYLSKKDIMDKIFFSILVSNICVCIYQYNIIQYLDELHCLLNLLGRWG